MEVLSTAIVGDTEGFVLTHCRADRRHRGSAQIGALFRGLLGRIVVPGRGQRQRKLAAHSIRFESRLHQAIELLQSAAQERGAKSLAPRRIGLRAAAFDPGEFNAIVSPRPVELDAACGEDNAPYLAAIGTEPAVSRMSRLAGCDPRTKVSGASTRPAPQDSGAVFSLAAHAG